jgi:hypothetical protein
VHLRGRPRRPPRPGHRVPSVPRRRLAPSGRCARSVPRCCPACS